MKKILCSAACVTGALLVASGPASAEEALPPAPPAAPAPPAPPTEAPSVTVAPGDHLWSISAARLGAGERWVEIYASNVDVLDSPDQIEAGQVLRLPTAPVAVPPELLAGLAGAPASNRTAAAAATTATTATTGTEATNRPVAPQRSSGGGGLANIRQCESGGNYQAVSRGGTYRGAYQFDQRTWESVGGNGDPAAASPTEQDARAQQLRSQRGNSPWSNCG